MRVILVGGERDWKRSGRFSKNWT